jgi:hypothetical protein
LLHVELAIAPASFDPSRPDALRAILQRKISDGARDAATLLATIPGWRS